MKNKLIMFGSHNKDSVVEPKNEVFTCILCDADVYFSKYGGVMVKEEDKKIEESETPLDPDVVFGKECLMALVATFLNTSLNMGQPPKRD